jgi:4'-phosphopantetheinyl transferase EntD
VLDIIARPAERDMLNELSRRRPEVAWDRLLFSAKESVYKAWAPVTGTFLDFDEAELTFDATAGSFVARLLPPGASVMGRELAGHFAVRDGLAVTAIARVRPPAPPMS